MELSRSIILLSLAVLFSLLAVPVASKLAKRIELVDKPTIRKRHLGNVPLAGGIVITLGIWAALPFIQKSEAIWAIAVLSLPLFLMGVVDDKINLSAKVRLLAQLSVGICLFSVFNVGVFQLDSVFSTERLIIAMPLAFVFTIVCVCGVLNAINMSDGIDGLLGGTSSISFCVIAALAIQSDAIPEAGMALVMLGLVWGYLAYNLGLFGSGKRVFLGDSGSMVVGLVLSTLLIALSQREHPVITPTAAGWILGLPLLDTVSVMVRRMTQGRSAFSAGRDHFHHLLQDLGMSRSATLKSLIILQVGFVSVGVFANVTDIPQYYFFWGFVLLTVFQYSLMSVLVNRLTNGVISEDGIKRIAVEEEY